MHYDDPALSDRSRKCVEMCHSDPFFAIESLQKSLHSFPSFYQQCQADSLSEPSDGLSNGGLRVEMRRVSEVGTRNVRVRYPGKRQCSPLRVFERRLVSGFTIDGKPKHSDMRL